MTVLGAIIAGGRSRRFGGDKAAARLDGRALIDHVATALARQVDEIVVVGRDWPGLTTIADRPAPGLGPLGGLLGALEHAAARGHARVMTAPCDCAGLPNGLAAILGTAPAVLRSSPLVGSWPAGAAALLRDHLAGDPQDRSMRRWIAVAGAAEIDALPDLANVNTRADLALLRRRADPRSSR